MGQDPEKVDNPWGAMHQMQKSKQFQGNLTIQQF
jgi:hypothetical protein